MFRSVLSSSRKYLAFALVLVLAFGAVAYYFTRQQPVPVTGAASVARAPAVSAPDANVAPSQGQNIDLGQGKILVNRPDGAQVVVNSNPANAPARNVSSAPNLGQRIYLGNGTFMIIHPDGSQEVSPSSVTSAVKKYVYLENGTYFIIHADGSQEVSPSDHVENRPNVVNPGQRIYLGNGTFMIIHPDGSQEIVPSGPVNSVPQALASNASGSGDGKLLTTLPDGLQIFAAESSQKVDAAASYGAGKFLTTLPDGLQIFAGGPAPEASFAPNQGGRTYLGDGSFMIVHPDGSQEITSSSGAGKLLTILPDGLQIFSAEDVTK